MHNIIYQTLASHSSTSEFNTSVPSATPPLLQTLETKLEEFVILLFNFVLILHIIVFFYYNLSA